VRLKASYDTTSATPTIRAILRAMMKYGMLVADNGAIYPIASEMTVGRAVTSDLVLDNDGVATKHARLFRTAPASGGGDERIYVEDFDSSAGTFVNGERIPARFPVALYENDVLAFGATTLRVLRRSDPGA